MVDTAEVCSLFRETLNQIITFKTDWTGKIKKDKHEIRDWEMKCIHYEGMIKAIKILAQSVLTAEKLTKPIAKDGGAQTGI